MNHAAFEDFATSASHERPPRSATEWVERTLERYPNVSHDQLLHLIAWFKAASALDVGLVASNEHLHDAYLEFRKDHVDRFTWADLVRAILFVLFFGGGVAGMVLLGMK